MLLKSKNKQKNPKEKNQREGGSWVGSGDDWGGRAEWWGENGDNCT